MKIKEFLIIRYGPLPNVGRISLDSFNLFFGKNEEGKTLMIDALVKLLLGRNIKDFEHIDRVEENPEGYVIIEDAKGKELKLPEGGNLTKITGFTPSECRNIFVIRNSDLSITYEGEFYTNVTDRLTGLRTEDISKIKESLRDLGKITPSSIFRDIKDEKLKTKIEKAKNLIEKIESLTEEIKKEKFDELEEEQVQCSEEVDGIIKKCEKLEDARKREKYEKGKEALDKLKNAQTEHKDLEIYNENEEQLWRDYEKCIQHDNDEKEALFTDLKESEKEFVIISEKLKQQEKDFQLFSERKKKLDEVRLDLRNYEIKSGELVCKEGKNKFFASVRVISTIFLGISLFGLVVNPSVLFYILAVLFLISTISLGIFKYQLVREKAWLQGLLERIKLALSKVELSAENFEAISSNIHKFDEEYSKKGEGLEEARRNRTILENNIKKLKEKGLEIKKKISDVNEKIDSLMRKSKETLLNDYINKHKLKKEYGNSLSKQGGILESLFGIEGKTLVEKISYWDEEVKNLEEYEDKARGVEYDEKAVSKLKEEENVYRRKLHELKEKIIHFKKRLEEIERETNKIIQIEADYLHCKTSMDLGAIKDKLQEFIDEKEKNKESVLKIMEIFEKIEKEEKRKISCLFGKDSSGSKYFMRITNGFYKEVLFNQTTGKIEVKHKDGLFLEADKLSGGAYDQLYFSIRLVLGEKLLKGERGLFVMDDPFIKADFGRLKMQLEMLKEMSFSGWQCLYFTAKDEVRNILKKDIDAKLINYIEV